MTAALATFGTTTKWRFSPGSERSRRSASAGAKQVYRVRDDE